MEEFGCALTQVAVRTAETVEAIADLVGNLRIEIPRLGPEPAAAKGRELAGGQLPDEVLDRKAEPDGLGRLR